jgi:hypothetical protein
MSLIAFRRRAMRLERAPVLRAALERVGIVATEDERLWQQVTGLGWNDLRGVLVARGCTREEADAIARTLSDDKFDVAAAEAALVAKGTTEC